MIITAPERVTTYLQDKKGDRLPFSCTLATLEANTDLADILKFATLSLKAGAGVKIVITEDFRLGLPRNFNLFQTLHTGHPDNEFFDEVIDPHHFNTAPKHATTIVVQDSISSILEAIEMVIQASKTVNNINVDLSALRPRDSVNSKGLVASGPVIFSHLFYALEFHLRRQTMHSLLKLLGMLNMVILRGGYKKGIITSAISDRSPYVFEYLDVPLVSLPGSHKKGIILSSKPTGRLLQMVINRVNSESLFLEKRTPAKGYANVCQGIFLRDRGTCLIYRINLGQITDLTQIVPAFKEATRRAIKTHLEWRNLHPERSVTWAMVDSDNQVAVDVMGLANMLHNLNISYDDFISALHHEPASDEALDLVVTLRDAYGASVEVADEFCEKTNTPLFAKLHCVEPAQSHSYRETDVNGNTVARGIWTPFSRFVNRMSHSAAEKVVTYDYGEIETHMTPDKHFKLCEGYYNLMAESGRPHSISYDTLVDFTPSRFDEWYNSTLPTLYYNLSKDYNTDYSRKVIKPVKLCSSCED